MGYSVDITNNVPRFQVDGLVSILLPEKSVLFPEVEMDERSLKKANIKPKTHSAKHNHIIH